MSSQAAKAEAEAAAAQVVRAMPVWKYIRTVTLACSVLRYMTRLSAVMGIT